MLSTTRKRARAAPTYRVLVAKLLPPPVIMLARQPTGRSFLLNETVLGSLAKLCNAKE